jgi:trigger factor
LTELNSKAEKTGVNEMTITINIDAETFEQELQKSYHANKGRVNIPGFRKGKITRATVEKILGAEYLVNDAVNRLLPPRYREAIEEHKLKPVSRPETDITYADGVKGAEIVITVTVEPEVRISNYLGLEYAKPETEATDEETAAEIGREREKNASIQTVNGRALKLRDLATIDFEGFVGGVPFEGGKSNNHKLEIGSKSFIDTFEEQLIGMEIGGEREVNVTFPEKYHAADLAGKESMFKVKLNAIDEKLLPEADDEFAQDVSDFDTFDEYFSDIKAKISERKARSAAYETDERVVEALLRNVEAELPQVMIDDEIEAVIHNFKQNITRQGMDFDMYCRYNNITEEGLREGNAAAAESRVKSRLALEYIAEKEGITVSEDEFDDEIGRLADIYKMEKENLMASLGKHGSDEVRGDLVYKKALAFVVRKAAAV